MAAIIAYALALLGLSSPVLAGEDSSQRTRALRLTMTSEAVANIDLGHASTLADSVKTGSADLAWSEG